MPHSPGAAPRVPCRQAGFSIIELVVVLLLVGILAAVALPGLDLDRFRSAGFYQQSMAAIRYAQKQAMSSGCGVEVEINALDADLCELRWSGCFANANLVSPVGGTADFCADSSPEGAVPSINFVFNRIGAPSAAQNFSVDGRTVVVEANTGFTYEP